MRRSPDLARICTLLAMSRSPLGLFAVLLLSAAAVTAFAADAQEASDLRTRVDKLSRKIDRIKKGKLKKFYAVRYRDTSVSEARHQCYLAMVDQVNLRKENKKRRKELKFANRELKKLRRGYGKLAGLSADQVAACEVKRTPECDKLLKLEDDHKTRYFRSEIDIMGDEARSIEESIRAHEKMAERAMEQCRQALASLG